MVELPFDHRPTNDDLNALNRLASGHDHVDRDYGPVLDRSLGYVTALDGDALVGFVNLAWDGGVHAFVLDTCVAPGSRRRGIASRMVKMAVSIARDKGMDWVHVDFEANLEPFYRACGFRRSHAGVVDLRAKSVRVGCRTG